MSKLVFFYDPSFPYKGERPTNEELAELKKIGEVVAAKSLSESLQNADCLIHLHGEYFPKSAWASILHFLKTGKAMLHVGGAPFKIPVREEAGQWVTETEQVGYHQQLHIHETHDVTSDRVDYYKADDKVPLFIGKENLFEVKPTFSFSLHVTKARDLQHENGSGGPMDAHFYPLMKGVTSGGRSISAPAVLLEHTKGHFSGGRWLFINQALTNVFWNNGGIEALGEWARYCAKGVTEIWVKTNYATYFEGEQPRLLVQLQALQREIKDNQDWTFQVTVTLDNQKNEWEHEFTLSAREHIEYSQYTIPIKAKPGFYHIICKAISSDGQQRTFEHGFWGFDEKLLQEGDPLRCGRDYFEKNGRPFPIVGMTHMTSDVSRKFLFLPNVSVWNEDMAHMKGAGINFLRTGLWTAWRSVMFVDGHPYEEVMRAIDAYILTAKKHDLEVTFNFFSFTPETWEGENPYLDPRSIEAQKRFISAVVSRHKHTTNVQWDLINEPSMFDPKRIFQGARTSGDVFEQKAFVEWLKERHHYIEVLQEHWNMTPDELPTFDSVELPEQDDINFGTTDKQSKKGNRWLDYSLFSMDMHNRWARALTKTIKAIAPNQLVTVGQDEALGGKRPSPFFYAEAVDYTTVHSWWLLDHLVWDSLFTKDPNKPNLVQETGIMHVERPDGSSKRSELESKSILERKYAYAFATGGAGAVQWLWNTNHYMNNINESNIGAVRSDQTEKPEADVSYDFGAFIPKIQDLFKGRELEDIVVVYPYSNDFSNRAFAFTSTAKLTRVLNYELKVPFRGISEYHLDSLKEHPPKLIIVPSAHNFQTSALEKIISHIKEYGGTLLWTGPISLDEYWRFRPRTSIFGKTSRKNILREERISIEGYLYPVSFLTDQQVSVTFGKNRLAELETETLEAREQSDSQGTNVLEEKVGNGKIIWCPLPIELNHRDEPLLALYNKAIKASEVNPELEWLIGGNLPGVYGRKVTFSEGYLYVFVSEDAYNNDIKVKDPLTDVTYSFKLQSDRTVMFATDLKGEVFAIYRPQEVSINKS
ncbi:beta-galactosidase [Evansella cellulosilytica]|uniref:Glycoside hydrolase family 42 domain protein n=1 Tax=Evansella cellulosilytica (strain ATCC 21833 / DSM 2522 / FERM P-1141 / JCM 9156 / N-4) TaxID=649639 RepID=E6U0G5_EVAC2|nr:beta-galactosidase [Evansella cellulosilytica]ADU31410.1 Glycoside hydrolase family 42 domain protein [Evansella cellulosilytica DSM 2522]